MAFDQGRSWEIITREREARGLNRAQLARLMNSNSSKIYRLEHRDGTLSVSDVVNLAQAWGCSTDYLLGLEHPKTARAIKKGRLFLHTAARA